MDYLIFQLYVDQTIRYILKSNCKVLATIFSVNKTCENFERSKARDNPGTSNSSMKRKSQNSLGSGTNKRQKRYEDMSETGEFGTYDRGKD